MPAIKYLNFVADIYGVSKEDRAQRIKKYADMFEITDNLTQPINSFSHGMKQKPAVTSALIHDPKLMLLDEPFVGLDLMASHLLKEQMRALCIQGRRNLLLHPRSSSGKALRQDCDNQGREAYCIRSYRRGAWQYVPGGSIPELEENQEQSGF